MDQHCTLHPPPTWSLTLGTGSYRSSKHKSNTHSLMNFELQPPGRQDEEVQEGGQDIAMLTGRAGSCYGYAVQGDMNTTHIGQLLPSYAFHTQPSFCHGRTAATHLNRRTTLRQTSANASLWVKLFPRAYSRINLRKMSARCLSLRLYLQQAGKCNHPH
jgi:hypothetical protein